MYRPPQYAVDDPVRLHRFVSDNPFAIVAVSNGGNVSFAYAPVILDRDEGPLGTIRLHVARANPIAAAAGRMFSFSFLGPDAYVSPDWYRTPALVPTWNYVAVEASGLAVRLEQPALQDLLAALTAEQEAKLAPKPPWTLDKVPPERQSLLLKAIVGFSVRLETLQGKFKLSQEKSDGDKSGVIAGLEAREEEGSRAIAREMRAFRS